jgi:D-alanyl-D-alanine carboxypeptidase (penicillin-binding protein 5/6)
MLRLCRLLITLVLVCAALLPRPAAAADPAPGEFTGKSKNAVLMDATSGAVLYQKNADELVAPASTSKLMTLAVLFKAMKSGQLKREDEFLMSVNAWRKGGAPSGTSAMMVPVNTKVRLDELIQGIIVQSGNDACIAVAEGMAGNEENFAKLMTEEARRIGLRKSTFANATGLFAPNHLMTARDLAILARTIITEYPDHYPVFGQKEFTYRKHKFFNRNPLLALGVGADGMKTGFVKESGYNLVGSAVQDGRRLIVVVMGLNSPEDRKIEAMKLIEWGFKSFSEAKLFDDGEIVGSARVWGGDRMYVDLQPKGELSIVLPKVPPNPRLRAEIVYKFPLKAPIAKGDRVATLRVTTPSGTQNEAPLYAAADVPRGGTIRRGLDTLVHLALRWVTL